MSRTRKIGLTIDDPLAPAAARPFEVSAPVTQPGTPERPDPTTQANEKTSGGKTRRRTRPSSASDGAEPPAKPSPTAPTARRGDPRDDGVRAGAWRAWGGPTRVASYRLPDELLAELANTAAELQLPIGLLVTAAIAHLLDEPAATIEALVDRADDARIQGRRASRRGADRRELEEAATRDISPSVRPDTL